MNDALPARDRSQGEPRSIGSLDGTCYLHIDVENFDFYLQVKPVHSARSRCDLITQADWWGLELIPEDENPAEVQEDGSIRVYLTPKVPVCNVESYMKSLPKNVQLSSIYQRTMIGAGAACALLGIHEILSAGTGILA